MRRCWSRLTVLALGDAAVLVGVRPPWHATVHGLAHPGRWLDAGPDEALGQLCSVLLWLAALWIALGLLAGVGTRLPGAVGRVCLRCARLVLPRVAVRVILGSTGLGLLAVPAAYAAGPTHPAAPTRVPVTSTWMHPSASSWLGDVAAAPWRSAAPAPVSSPAGPVTPPTWPSSSAPTHENAPPQASGARAHVRSGDSLWVLAARRLGPNAAADDVAHYWHRIYAANRSVVGDDPSVIHPGQVLRLPTPAPTEESP
ncbi:LysM peptidoglycan-binding domain-containing protein [uncultured Jatrophihabitans sp.]|uniref:LysM peptidoglycan-binding domain-containing protein n=1 Tax=uncultured Jatrophihabitans sp. TaxID=1610747 RepID=UPI0035CA1771